jgi:hypothetical protein
MRIADRLAIAVFLVALVVPLGASVAGLGAGTTLAESATAGGRARSLFGWFDYFDDHFGFRQQLITAHSLVAWRGLRASPSPTVIKGRDGWLFYADDSALDDYESAIPLDDGDLAAWRDALVSIRDRLRAQGVAYVFAVAPDKHVLYPEYMPSSIHRLHDEYRMDQLLDYLETHSDLTVVDLRKPLLARKSRERIYHLTDTHWNDRGAFVGYTEIMAAAGRQVPGLAPLPRSAFEPIARDRPGMDLAEMLSLSGQFTERSLDLAPRFPRRARLREPADLREGYEVARVVTEHPDAALPRMVMFRDSFATALIPFLSEHFSRAIYLWQNNVDDEVIAKEKPSLVIHEIVGRRLQTLVPEGVE